MLRFLISVYFSAACLCLASPRYDQVCWLCTHNAMSASDGGWRMPNQTHTISKQLNSGIHALMLDIWKQDGKLVLRHGPEISRYLGYKPLSTELATIEKYLLSNKEAIVTLILESYASAVEVTDAIKAAKLDKFCHTQDPTKPWPTLATLRQSGKRLIIFSDRPGKNADTPLWYMPMWKHCWETNWVAKNTNDLLTAKPRRGKTTNQLMILNHFITNGIASKTSATLANKNPFLKKRVDLAVEQFGRLPNFLVLDFYEIGDGRQVVDQINKR